MRSHGLLPIPFPNERAAVDPQSSSASYRVPPKFYEVYEVKVEPIGPLQGALGACQAQGGACVHRAPCASGPRKRLLKYPGQGPGCVPHTDWLRPPGLHGLRCGTHDRTGQETNAPPPQPRERSRARAGNELLSESSGIRNGTERNGIRRGGLGWHSTPSQGGPPMPERIGEAAA